MESDATITDYYVNGLSEFKNNLIHAGTAIYKSGNTAIATSSQLQTKAESEGCITYTDPANIKLTSPFYSTAPNFLPLAGSPALSGSSFTGMNAFFTATTYVGAFGTVDWTSAWTNWDPQNKGY